MAPLQKIGAKNGTKMHKYLVEICIRVGLCGIAPTFLKLDSWSPWAGYIPIISTKGINQIKKGKL